MNVLLQAEPVKEKMQDGLTDSEFAERQNKYQAVSGQVKKSR
jgi:hypothetical protein